MRTMLEQNYNAEKSVVTAAFISYNHCIIRRAYIGIELYKTLLPREK